MCKNIEKVYLIYIFNMLYLEYLEYINNDIIVDMIRKLNF